MDELFLSVLNMSVTGAFVIAAIAVLRLPLKKVPKIISYCLWAVAGFRLIFPFSISSVISLIPFNAAPVPQNIAMQAIPRINSGISSIDNAVSGILPTTSPSYSANQMEILIAVGMIIWLAGVVIMVGYGIASYLLLKHKMRASVSLEANIYEAKNIQSPFLLGIVKPIIYIPTGLTERERDYVTLHEKIHIRRRDHIVKFAAYFILCLHWFNPLVWLAFVLMSADMELSCDERALKEMGGEVKHDYSRALLSLATGQRTIGGSPLAFSEGGIKERVKNVLNFKKHSRIVIITAVVLVAALSAGFAVNRAGASDASDTISVTDSVSLEPSPLPDLADTPTPTPALASGIAVPQLMPLSLYQGFPADVKTVTPIALNNVGWYELGSTISVAVQYSGNSNLTLYYAEAGTEITPTPVSFPINKNTDTQVMRFDVGTLFPDGFMGHFWVSTDADPTGNIYSSEVINVIYPKPGYDVNGNLIADATPAPTADPNATPAPVSAPTPAADSPYKIAATLADAEAMIAANDGTIPVTNVQVPEILDGTANGIIITVQDLNVALKNLNDCYYMPGGYAIKNLVTASIGGLPPSTDPADYDKLLAKYTDFGVYLDKDTNTWMYGGKPIGVLVDGSEGELLFAGIPAYDVNDPSLADELAGQNYAYLNTVYYYVAVVDGISEMTPEQTVSWLQRAARDGVQTIQLSAGE